MKRIFLVILLLCFLSSCTPPKAEIEEGVERITLEVRDENGDIIEQEVPLNPKKIVVLSHISLDILNSIGVGNRIVGMIKGNVPTYLSDYVKDERIVNVGGLKEIDLELIMSLEPDIIFSSDRTSMKFSELSMIAPTVPSYIDYKVGFFESFKSNVIKHAKIFDKEDSVNDTIKSYEDRIFKIAQKSKGKTALLGMFGGGVFNTLGSVGRASIIVNEMGFTNITGNAEFEHGVSSSFELKLKENPDYMFILDNDASVNTKVINSKLLMDNQLVHKTKAYQNGNIVYLEPNAVWYLCDGGITAMDLMISNIEDCL